MPQNKPQQPQTTNQQQRLARQQQPHSGDAKTSRPIVQPIILGTLTLASAPTQTTVGSAGSASALPATPTGYLQINIGTANVVIPFYTAA